MRVRISWIFFRQAKNRLKNWTEINIFETVCILPTSTLTTPSANLQYSWSLHRTVKWNKEITVLWEDLKRFPSSSTLKIELNYYFFHNCIHIYHRSNLANFLIPNIPKPVLWSSQVGESYGTMEESRIKNSTFLKFQ